MYLLREEGSCSPLISMSKFRSFPHFKSMRSPTFQFRIQFTSIPLNSLVSIPLLCVAFLLVDPWRVAFPLSLSHFHILCLPVLPSLSNLSWSLLLSYPQLCSLSRRRGGAGLIALRFDWHSKYEPGQQRPHLHHITKWCHEEISFSLFFLAG